MTEEKLNSGDVKKETTKNKTERVKRRPYARKNEKKVIEKNIETKSENKEIKPVTNKTTRRTKRTESIERTTKRTKNDNNIFKKGSLKIIPLGGLHEVGKNITVFEYENEIIVVDCGLCFPEDDMLGIDLVIPDISYLVKNQDKIKGLVVTHGHEDHIGAIPYLLKQINIPIYATKLTVGLIQNKLEEHKLLRSTKLNIVNQGDTIKLGSKFEVEFIRSSHSIPDSVMLAITTPAGTVLHTGDFKVDYTPIDGQVMDLGRIAEIGIFI